ncbi:hypothetical protein MD484_g6479, partial [Candolleomyces efflorescens]
MSASKGNITLHEFCLSLVNHFPFSIHLLQKMTLCNGLSNCLSNRWLVVETVVRPEAPFYNLDAEFGTPISLWGIAQAADFLLNWRSEIGRNAILITAGILQNELKDDLGDEDDKVKWKEAGIEAAIFLLRDHRFVYGNPDAEEDESAEPFESPFVLQTFTYHLRQVIHVAKGYDIKGNAIGALGLCAAAVERALTLISDGHVSITKEGPPDLLPPVHPTDAGTGGESSSARTGPGSGKRRKATFTPFSESAWGSQTRAFATMSSKLPEEQWDSITLGAITDDIQQTINSLLSDDEDLLDGAAGGSGGNQDSRANLRM